MNYVGSCYLDITNKFSLLQVCVVVDCGWMKSVMWCNHMLATSKHENETQYKVPLEVSGFHLVSLLSVTFINRLMHSVITAADVKIYVI